MALRRRQLRKARSPRVTQAAKGIRKFPKLKTTLPARRTKTTIARGRTFKSGNPSQGRTTKRRIRKSDTTGTRKSSRVSFRPLRRTRKRR